jgi:hypothetical protein
MTTTDLQTSISALVALTDADLELELGRRLELATKAFDLGDLAPTTRLDRTIDDEQLMGAPDFLRGVARKFQDRFNQQMYSLICEASDLEHAKIREAVTAGAEHLGYVLAGLFFATFGWMPAVATVVGAIVAKRVMKAGHGALCEQWKASVE